MRTELAGERGVFSLASLVPEQYPRKRFRCDVSQYRYFQATARSSSVEGQDFHNWCEASTDHIRTDRRSTRALKRVGPMQSGSEAPTNTGHNGSVFHWR